MYSYGILLLEMLTGKKPVDPMFEGGLGLHSYARRALADGCVLQIVGPVLLSDDVNENCLISLVKVGVQCSNESPQDRMDIGNVIHELFGTTFASRS
ncbi:putative non-specific serine/threonine protein kinase [Helianthus annuus]|nr:putative non-specific serine/threonine protein kinase [Helianthus annuus]